MSDFITRGFRRLVRLRALPAAVLGFALVGCDQAQPLDPEGSVTEAGVATDEATVAQDEVVLEAVDEAASEAMAAARSGGGIPFGMTSQPVKDIGDVFSGGKVTVTPQNVRGVLSAVRARGGRVVIMLAGHPKYYKDGGRFSLSKWKARVGRFKGVDINSYISDGTVIGHYLIDEPQDKANWRGTSISPGTVDEMAKFSKQLWPRMATIVRTHPSFFKSNPRYVDAAWAQYLARRGSVQNYIRQSVSDAQRRGLALVVGLNVVDGGIPNGTKMTPGEVQSFGSALLSSSYPCAFVSWKHAGNLSSGSMRSALKSLRQKADSRPRKSCMS